VRQALITAIDPRQWDQVWNLGEGKASPSHLQTQQPCFEPATANDLANRGDLNAAKAILTQAGWTAGADGKFQKNGQPLRLVVLTTPTSGPGSEFIAETFNKLGATATVVTSTTPITDAGDFDVTLNPGHGRLPITTSVPGMFTGRFPPAGTNQTRVVDPVLDDLVVKARAEEPGVCTSWKAWQRRLLTEYHSAPFPAFRVRWFGKNLKPVFLFGDYADARTFIRTNPK
jgi:peptide/nickel transport system substrate-binding protein